MCIASAVASRAQTPQSPRAQCGAVAPEKSVVHTSAPSLHPSLHPNLHCHRPSAERHQVMERMQARSEVLMRFARPRFPLCEPPTLLEPLCPSGASETLARTEWPAQQQRPASGLRNEVSVWRASSAAPGHARGRPQGETKRVLGASFGRRRMVIVENGERCQARTHRPRAAQVKGTTPHYGGQPAVIFKQHEK